MPEKIFGHKSNRGFQKGNKFGFRKGNTIGFEYRFKKGHKGFRDKESYRNNSWNKGSTKEVDKRIQNISNKLKGHQVLEETKEKIKIKNQGKHFSPKTEFQKKDIRISGINNYNYKGGITPLINQIRHSFEYNQWHSNVFNRDNFTCWICGKRDGNHNAHHIYNFSEYPEIRFDVELGVTLCEKCHKKFHKIYGYKHNDFEQFLDFCKRSDCLIN